MNPKLHDAYARLERVRRLWVELAGTPDNSPLYETLAAEIHLESVAYLSAVDAARYGHGLEYGSARTMGQAERRDRPVTGYWLHPAWEHGEQLGSEATMATHPTSWSRRRRRCWNRPNCSRRNGPPERRSAIPVDTTIQLSHSSG